MSRRLGRERSCLHGILPAHISNALCVFQTMRSNTTVSACQSAWGFSSTRCFSFLFPVTNVVHCFICAHIGQRWRNCQSFTVKDIKIQLWWSIPLYVKGPVFNSRIKSVKLLKSLEIWVEILTNHQNSLIYNSQVAFCNRFHAFRSDERCVFLYRWSQFIIGFPRKSKSLLCDGKTKLPSKCFTEFNVFAFLNLMPESVK